MKWISSSINIAEKKTFLKSIKATTKMFEEKHKRMIVINLFPKLKLDILAIQPAFSGEGI